MSNFEKKLKYNAFMADADINLHLKGYNFFKFGMDSLMTLVESTPFGVVYMSDNLFIWIQNRFYSLDGAKMEASHSDKGVASFMTKTLEHLNIKVVYKDS